MPPRITDSRAKLFLFFFFLLPILAVSLSRNFIIRIPADLRFLAGLIWSARLRNKIFFPETMPKKSQRPMAHKRKGQYSQTADCARSQDNWYTQREESIFIASTITIYGPHSKRCSSIQSFFSRFSTIHVRRSQKIFDIFLPTSRENENIWSQRLTQDYKWITNLKDFPNGLTHCVR